MKQDPEYLADLRRKMLNLERFDPLYFIVAAKSWMLVCAQAHAILNAHDIAARETAGVFDSFCMLQDNASSVLIF